MFEEVEEVVVECSEEGEDEEDDFARAEGADWGT